MSELPLWSPGKGCPVPNCLARTLADSGQMNRHWAECHEQVVKVLNCSECTAYFKRKSNLNSHYRRKHGPNVALAVGRIEYLRNKEFLDPGPIKLSNIFMTKIDSETGLQRLKFDDFYQS